MFTGEELKTILTPRQSGFDFVLIAVYAHAPMNEIINAVYLTRFFTHSKNSQHLAEMIYFMCGIMATIIICAINVFIVFMQHIQFFIALLHYLLATIYILRIL
jgi:hypothetical protein